MDEKEAIRRLKRDDISELEHAVACHQAKTVLTAYLSTRDSGLAEDIVQDTSLQLYHTIGGFNETCPFEPWFMGNMVKACGTFSATQCV